MGTKISATPEMCTNVAVIDRQNLRIWSGIVNSQEPISWHQREQVCKGEGA